MGLTKQDLVEQVVRGTGLAKDKSMSLVDNLLEIVKASLAQGDDVLVSGFGKFCVKAKNERKGRNPATGEAMRLRERKVVTFKCSGILREKINGN